MLKNFVMTDIEQWTNFQKRLAFAIDSFSQMTFCINIYVCIDRHTFFKLQLKNNTKHSKLISFEFQVAIHITAKNLIECVEFVCWQRPITLTYHLKKIKRPKKRLQFEIGSNLSRL